MTQGHDPGSQGSASRGSGSPSEFDRSQHSATVRHRMRFVRAQSNPKGMADTELFLLTGSVAPGPVEQIEANPGWDLLNSSLPERDVPFRLRIFHFNDLHGFISRIKPGGDSPVFSRMVSLVKEMRQRYQDHPDVTVLFVAGGDEQVGSLFDELLGHDEGSFQIHAGYHAYSAAGVDVGVVGNHDLDKGANLLAHALQQDAQFPILSANVISGRYLNRLCYPAALFRVKGVRIGIVGLTTAGKIRPQEEADFAVIDPLKALRNLLPAFKPYCDVIIILSHLGYSAASDAAVVMPLGDVELAQALERCEVDLIIGGHTHHPLNEQSLEPANIVNCIPIVQAGRLGQFLGSVDIMLRRRSAAVSNARLITVSDLPVDECFEEAVVQPLLERARPILETPLGTLADDPGLSTVTVRNCFAAEEIPLANFVTDGLVSRCRAHDFPVDLALVDAADIRCGLPLAPEVTLGMWLWVMPFADTIQLCHLSGHQLKMLLEDNARRIDLPDEPHTDRGFLQFSGGVRYTIHVFEHERAACYASDITINGVPIDDQLDRTFVIACSSHVRQSCASWEKQVASELELSPVSLHSEEIARFDTGLLVSHELRAYIRKQGGITPESGAKLDGRLRVVA